MATPTSDSRRTQRAKLLALLVRAHGGWVPLPEVMAAAGAQYGARVHSLRHDLNFHIENWQEGGHSWFRLVPGPEPIAPACLAESLFGSLEREHRDDG